MTFKEILDKIGEAATLEQTAEECAAEEEICERIHEELADLMTCVDVLINIPWINTKKVQEIQIRKARRWGERIQKE